MRSSSLTAEHKLVDQVSRRARRSPAAASVSSMTSCRTRRRRRCPAHRRSTAATSTRCTMNGASTSPRRWPRCARRRLSRAPPWSPGDHPTKAIAGQDIAQREQTQIPTSRRRSTGHHPPVSGVAIGLDVGPRRTRAHGARTNGMVARAERSPLHRDRAGPTKPQRTGAPASAAVLEDCKQPPARRPASPVRAPKDYVRLKLTGERAIDVADASGTLLLDVAQRRWSDEVLDARDRRRPGCRPCSSRRRSPAARPAGVAVAAGAGDQAAGGLGVGVDRPGPLSVAMGTSGVVFAALPGTAPTRRRACTPSATPCPAPGTRWA